MSNPASGQVQLSWTAPSANGGLTIAGYRVEQSTNGGGTWAVLTPNTGTTGTTFIATGLTDGQTMVFRVAAVTSMGAGAWATASTNASAVATAPRDFAVTTSDLTFNFSWVAPTNTGGFPITGYRLESCQSSLVCVPTTLVNASIPASSSSYTAQLPSYALAYTFRLTAITAAGLGAPATVTVGSSFTVSMPDGLSATASDQQVVLSWSAPTQLGSMRVQGYQVEQSDDRGVTWVTLSPGFLSGLTYTVRGLTNGSHYLFRIRALTSAGLGSPAVVESMPTGMAGTPRDFAGTSPASGTARLTWSAPTDLGGLALRGYKLEYNTSSFASAWSNLTTLGPNATSYDWTNLSNGTTVYFRLSAITDAGVASANGAMTATFVSWTATAPTSLTSAPGDRQVTLNWGGPNYNGGYTVYGYRVEQSVDGVNWTVLESTEYSGSFTSRGLTNGVSYRFRVAAVTARGVGEYSFVTSQPNALALAPQNLSTTAGDGRITLNWTAPPSSGGLPILGYQVQSLNYSTWYVILGNSGSTATTVTVPGLTNGTTLWFRVAAMTSAGVGEVSAQTLGTPYVAPAAAFNLVSTPGDSSIALSWTAPAANGNTALGGPWSIVGYRIEQSADNGVTWVALADPLTPASTVTYTAYGLTNGLNYQFRITALTQAGSGAPAFISGTPMTTPSAVQGLVVSPSDGSVTFAWRAPLSNGGSVITGYQLEYCTPWCAAPATLAENNIDPLATSFTLNGLTNGSTYNFRLRARTAAGLDPNGATVSAVPVRIPGVVDTLTASTQVVGTGAAQATYVTLSWAAPLVLGSDIARTYSVELSLNGGTSWSTVSSSQTALSFSWAPNGVAAGTIVSFRVRATNIAGVGPGSIVTTTVPVQTSGAPPGTAGAPITLQTTGGDSQVTVSWAPPATTGGLPVTGYRIESSSDNATWSVLSTAATSPYVVSGLTNGAVRYFRVAAITSAGVGATSVVSALPGNVPSAPLGLTGTFFSPTLTLTWSLPADSGGAANTSVIERSTDGGATWVFVGNWGAATTATIDGVAAGVATLFRVSARNSFGTGPGTVVSVTGPTPTAVSAVQNLSSVSTAAGATVSWTAPAVTGASTVTGYKVERSANGSTWTTISASQTALTADITGFTTGWSEFVRVTPVVSSGTVAASTIKVLAGTQFAAPTALSAVAGDGTATVSWTAPVMTSGLTIIGYQIEQCAGACGGSNAPFAVLTPNSGVATASYVATGLVNGVSYELQWSQPWCNRLRHPRGTSRGTCCRECHRWRWRCDSDVGRAFHTRWWHASRLQD